MTDPAGPVTPGAAVADLAAADADCRPQGPDTFSRQIRAVTRRLQAAHRHLLARDDGTAVPGAVEWLFDNWFLIADAMRQAQTDLPPRFIRTLPRRAAAPDAGTPRAWRLARTLVEASGDFLDLAQAERAVEAYQEHAPLAIGELWALPGLFRFAILAELTACAEQCAGTGPTAHRPGGLETRVAGCISSLRRIAVHDWKTFVETLSRLDALLRQDPAGAHARADFSTRDRYRRAVEEVARAAGTDEWTAARAALTLSRAAPAGSAAAHVGYYLVDAGQPALERHLGCGPPLALRLRRAIARHATAFYLGGVAAGTVTLLTLPALYLLHVGASIAASAVVMILAAVPAAGIAVPVVNWIVTHLFPPRVLARLEFDEAVPPRCRTVVAVPTLLTSEADVAAMLRQLEINFQGNADPAISFALLTDGPDAAERERPEDAALLAAAVEGVDELNRRYEGDGGARFVLLYRPRRWNPAEGHWMGWERKRGKLSEFNRLLLGRRDGDLRVHAGPPEALEGVRYVITLDADTVLPGGAAASLIGTLAHPLNAAELDEETGAVRRGYTVLQPRVEIAGRSAGETAFARIYEGEAGLDLYTHAVSDAYHDLFGEGIYAGKGIYDVAAFERALEGRIPDNALLSHDLFEGIHGRAGFASHVQLLEDYPSHVIGYARRLHRWIRGDWQLLPWLGRRVPRADGTRAPTPLALIDRWKIADNLRRSLTAPAVLVLFVTGWLWLPGAAWFWTLLSAGTLAVPIVLGAATTANRIVTGAALRPTLRRAIHSAGTDALRWILALVFLAFESAIVVDAVTRTLVRRYVTGRHLLEWQSAALTARRVARARGGAFVWGQMAASPAIAVAGGAAVALVTPASLAVALPLLVAWLVAPQVAYLLSRPRIRSVAILTPEERRRLRRLARRTWHYFEQVLSPDHGWLAPDNLQEQPVATVAERTSPTNIGMGLLATLSAYDLGYLGLRSVSTALANGVQGLAGLERFRGHCFNWYDTRTGAVLAPRYISVVDSGNLAAALIALQEGCLELEDDPVIAPGLWRGLRDTADVLRDSVAVLTGTAPETARLLDAITTLDAALQERPETPAAQRAALTAIRHEHLPAIETALADAIEGERHGVGGENLRTMLAWLDRLRAQTDRVVIAYDTLAPWAAVLDDAPAPVRDALARFPTLREATRLLVTLPPSAESAPWAVALAQAADSAREVLARLATVATQARHLLDDMDFTFLYDRHRLLFHIGYDVDAGRLDGGYYDLLASEARLASLVAIARRDVPERHWLHLGRPFGRVGRRRVLLSWGGTMFEYLMPALLADLPDEALLTVTCATAVHGQQQYAHRHGIPWGISESGFHQLSPEGHYQYRAFGVPGHGLKRDLGDRLVVSPYASLLALPLVPREVAANTAHLEALGAMGQYGLYEALDFGAPEAGAASPPAVVRAYMSHHQGMILVALGNHLAGNRMVRRFHRDPQIASVEYLLFEQVPRHAPIYRPPRRPPARTAARGRARHAPWQAHPAPTPQLHVLSNGRYSVLVSGAGGGGSRWRGQALTRWRAEAGVDQWGHWLYLQDRDRNVLWSVGRQPVHAADTDTSAYFSAAAAEYRARAHDIAAQVVVTVPPGDDLEVRLVTLTNESRGARRLALTGFFEVALARPADDLRHQAFTKLFVESEVLDAGRTLVFRRRPGGPDPDELFLGHAVVAPADVSLDCSAETDRARFLGPGGRAARPAALETGQPLEGTAGATLDPAAALRCTLDLAPGQEVTLAFITAAAGSRAELLGRLGSYAGWSRIERAFEEATIQAEGALNALNVAPAELQTMQRLFSALLVPDARLRPGPDVLAGPRLPQSGLWPFGISGDLPILVLRATGDRADQLDVIRTALKFHTVLRRRGCEIDLVMLDEVSAGYHQPYYERLDALVSEAGADAWRGRKGGVFLLRARDLSPADRACVEASARAVLDTSRPLAAQLAILDRPAGRLPPFAPVRHVSPEPAGPPAGRDQLLFDNGLGGFTPDGAEYVVRIGRGSVPPRAWAHVVANPEFGFVVSAAGGGFTWAVNSAERRLTPWSNDLVTDRPGEVLYLRDEETGAVWSATPAPAGTSGPYTVRFGAGYAVFCHRAHGLEQTMRLSVAPDDPVKLIELTIENATNRPRRLTATYYAEWVLGTSRHRSGPHVVPEFDAAAAVLLARNPFHVVFPDRTAFLTASRASHGVSTDRVEFVGEDGDLSSPAALGRIGPAGAAAPGGDACGALQIHVDLAPGEQHTVHFALGDAADRETALALARRYRDPHAVQAAGETTRTQWESLLGQIQVRTPDPAFDLLMNRWLLYQTTACRLWARSALSQSGGAFGFRDQTQDVLALATSAPDLTRAHLLTAARHQFAEGDVLHWWHPGSGQGVRTRCADDLVWLPFAVAHYLSVTADHGILDEQIPFLTGDPLAPEEGDRFAHFPPRETGSLYEHCLRALDHSDRLGQHALPLFGTGDWNDGMNRVGAGGRGESVWLAWFLAATLRAFAPVCERRGEGERAAEYRARAAALAAAVEREGWDGAWYLRGFYDDGAPLGASGNEECRIDAVAQSWAVISGAADPGRAAEAMRSVYEVLTDERLEVLRLFDPPFDRGSRDPGYVRAYPPGVRENGGQYTHAAIWTIWATALLGDGDRLGAFLSWLNPVNRTATPAGVARYRGEPYAVAADVSTVPLHTGAAGWTWYTGSAAWMYRLGIEMLLGLRREGDTLHVDPCIPAGWEGFEVVWRHGTTRYHIRVRNPEHVCRGVRTVTVDGRPVSGSGIPLTPDGEDHDVQVVLGSVPRDGA